MSDTIVTKRSKRQAGGPYGKLGQVLNDLDDRMGVAKGGRTFLDKIFPDHWSFMLGEIALYSFIVLLITGVYLALYYVPSSTIVTYHGAYLPLVGQKVSEAYASSVNLSFAVRGGLLMRQMHHWACDIFVGSIVVHMARVFFTGAFRKPRETNWLIGITMLILAIVNGFLGYSLPDDLVSGTGIRIAFSILLSIPLVGSYLAFWLFGGNYPGHVILERFYVLHVFVVPLILLGMVSVHMFLLVRQKHTQFPGKGRTEKNVVGAPMYPIFIAKTTGYLFIIGGVIALLGTFAQINPIWQFGQYDPHKISYAVQPDWYMGFLDGALRIWPSWTTHNFGHTIPWEVFIPAVILPGIVFNICMAWPSLERRFTKDDAMHNLLDRPRDRPVRTAFGSAMLSFVFMLFVASATDVLAQYFRVSLNEVLVFMRFAVTISPFIGFVVAYALCKELQKVEHAGRRKVPNVVTRTASGEYVAVAAPQRPDDIKSDLAPIPMPGYVTPEVATATDPGVRHVDR